MKDEKQGWLSVLGAVVVLYWGAYFMVRFFTVVKRGTLVVFIIICIIVGLLIRMIFRWVAKKFVAPIVDGMGDHISEQPLPFFVKGQVRRRKLDVTRSSNFVSDSIGTKYKRQVRGILRKKKKKGGR